MKITKETKIGDILPEGYELCFSNKSKLIFSETMDDIEYLNIPLKKKEEKNFEWYIERYLTNPFGHLSHLKNWFSSGRGETLKIWLLANDLEAVPFEIKIGLLKFICDDLNIEFLHVLTYIKSSDRLLFEGSNKLVRLCPKEFLESIFK